MAFFKKLSDRVSSTVATFANRVNLDRLIDEDGAKGASAADLGPEYAHLNLTYVTDNVIGK